MEATTLFTYPNYSEESKEARGILDINESTLAEMSAHAFGLQGIPYYQAEKPREHLQMSQY